MSISNSLGEQHVAGLASGSVSYRDRGDGAPVLFVHGLAMNADLWRNVVPPLVDAGLRCITPDWPLGSQQLPMAPHADLSPPGVAAMVAEFIDALELQHVTLVGNDTGGAVCQLVATQYPSQVGRLVLASCDAYDVFPPKPFGYLKWIAKVPGGLRVTMSAMQWPAVRQSVLAYGRTMNRAPAREVFDSYTRPAQRSAAIRRDTARMLAGLSTVHT